MTAKPPPPSWPMPETFSVKATVETKAQVAFFNSTDRKCLAFWYDPNGKANSYGTINAKAYAPTYTFWGHVWSFHDIEDGSFLWPAPSKPGEVVSTPYVTIPTTAKVGTWHAVLLKRPVEPLAKLASRAIIRRCDNVDALPLPAAYKDEIKQRLEEKAYINAIANVAPPPGIGYSGPRG